MATYLFDIGSSVSLNADWRPSQKAGRYIVEAQMPPLGTLLQYRIKSENEGFRRVVVEHQLASYDEIAELVPAASAPSEPEPPHAARTLPGEAD